jgi:hypothetical protein
VGHDGPSKSIPRRRNQSVGCARRSNEHKRCAAMRPHLLELPFGEEKACISLPISPPISPLSHPMLHCRKMKREAVDDPADVLPGTIQRPHMREPPCNRYGSMTCSTRRPGTSYLTPGCLSHSYLTPISPDIRVTVLKPPEVCTSPPSVRIDYTCYWPCLHAEIDDQQGLQMYYLTTLYSRVTSFTLILEGQIGYDIHQAVHP